MITRRQTVTGLAALAALPWLRALPAWAQAPAIEIIAAAGPGGGYDTLARTVQSIAEKRKLASNVQVINVPGAGGTVGLARFVNDKKPTATLTVGLGMVGAVILNKAPVTLDEITPLARLQGEYQPLVVAADSPLRSLEDLVKKFKEDPGSVSWGGFGLGSPDHLVCAMVLKAVGGDVRRMNYIVTGAGSEMLPLVISGKITVATGGYAEFADHIKSGRLRAIGISSPERISGIDVPTFKEQGVDAELVNWRGLAASPGLAGEQLRQLDEIMGQVAASEEWKAACELRGWSNLYLPSADFATFVKEEQTRVAALLNELGLSNQ